MNFAFSPEQHSLRDVAREVFEKESPPLRVRELFGGAVRDARVWRTMGEVGLTAVTVPEEFGGMGGNEIDLALVLEEAGRAALPEPLVETIAVAAPLLSEAGTPAQRETWLPRIAKGDALVTVLLADAPYAVDAGAADLLLWQHGDELHALPAENFVATQVRTEDGARRIFTVEPSSTAGTKMAGGASEAARAFDRAAAATASVLNGIASRMLEMTVEHVKARQQFGRPVGSFQAVKHKLASAAVLVDASRSAAWYAAYAIARDLADRSTAASVAKSTAADAASFVNTEALQCHAGIGFTWEHDLHLWLKRGKALEAAYGTATEHRSRIARAAFDEGALDA